MIPRRTNRYLLRDSSTFARNDCHSNTLTMQTSLDRAEREVEQQSAALKKPLGLSDLVLTQILFIVGSSWVGTAAKLGQAHLFFCCWRLCSSTFHKASS